MKILTEFDQDMHIDNFSQQRLFSPQHLGPCGRCVYMFLIIA